MMGKKKESRSLQMIKKTSNDINQLFNELTTGLSHEYLYSEDKKDDSAIKGALDIINELNENFLERVKVAMDLIIDEQNGKKKYEDPVIVSVNEEIEEEVKSNRVPLH